MIFHCCLKRKRDINIYIKTKRYNHFLDGDNYGIVLVENHFFIKFN